MIDKNKSLFVIRNKCCVLQEVGGIFTLNHVILIVDFKSFLSFPTRKDN